MESIIVACITGVVTLVGVIISNSKSRAVMEVKLSALTAKQRVVLAPGAHDRAERARRRHRQHRPDHGYRTAA